MSAANTDATWDGQGPDRRSFFPGSGHALLDLEGKGRQGAACPEPFTVSLYWSYFSDANDRQS